MTTNETSRARRAALVGALALATTVGAAACGRGDAEDAPRDTAADASTGGRAAGTPPAGTASGDAGGAAGRVTARAADRPEVVTLDTAAARAAGIRVEPVARVATSGLSVTGTITYDANRVSHVGARTPGRIVTLGADIGQRVRAGQTLALLESPEVGQLRADAGEAEVLERIARENYARERRLEEQGISSRKELLAAEADLRRAEAARQSARERLRVLGASGGRGSQFAATAPFAGVVVARAASRGEMASPEDQLFTVADLSHVWIELDVFERDLSRVRTGQPVTLNAAAFPGRTFPGRIVYLGAVVDTARRTVRARVEIPNADGALRPGMFATARVQTGEDGPALIVVPQEAVQEVEGRRAVFVPGDRPGQFRVVPVDVGETLDGGRVVIRTGLTPASRVVTAGAFLLRSELAKREIGEAGH